MSEEMGPLASVGVAVISGFLLRGFMPQRREYLLCPGSLKGIRVIEPKEAETMASLSGTRSSLIAPSTPMQTTNQGSFL